MENGKSSAGTAGQGQRLRGRSAAAPVAAAAVNAAAFYLLPLLIRDTGSGMFVLLFALPCVCLLAGFACGCAAGLRWYYPIVIALLFIPVIFLYLNETAALYAPIYGLIAFAGNLAGAPVRRLRLGKRR